MAVGAFARVDVEFSCSGAYIAYERVGADKFGVHHVGSQLFAYKPERVVGDILHWSKHYRARSEVDVSYLHGCEVTNFRVNTVRGIPKGVWKIAKKCRDA